MLEEWLAANSLSEMWPGLREAGFTNLNDLRAFAQEGDAGARLQGIGLRIGDCYKLVRLLREPAVTPPANAEPRMERCVFVSYGHDENCTFLANRLQDDLSKHGYRVWTDREIQFGHDWREEITKAIYDSHFMIAMLSVHSIRKRPGVCRQEIAIALNQKSVSLLTVLVEPEKEVKPPPLVSRRQWLDMSSLGEKLNDRGFEAWYRENLEKLIAELGSQKGFSGEIDRLKRWLWSSAMDCHAELVAFEKGFSGRKWLLGGLAAWDAQPIPDANSRSGSADAGDEDAAGEIETWRKSLTDERVFWICAEPGWGKSAVAARLAHSASARVMAVHFCSHDKPHRNDARLVVRSIAFQMATQFPDYRRILLALCEADQASANSGWTIEQMTASELFATLLANPLEQVIRGDIAEDRFLIVLDALDESLQPGGNHGSELVNLLAAEFGKLPDWMRLVVTSRREDRILRQLGVFGMRYFESGDEKNRADIRAYARALLERMKQAKTLSESAFQQALDAVCHAADGNFLYLRNLEAALSSGDVLTPQELLTPGSLPKGLAGMYCRWFERRFATVEDYEQKVLPLLELLLAAQEPLPLSLARVTLNWDDRKQARVLAALGSLLRRDDDDRLQFFHKSLADWLQDEEAAGPDWLVGEKEGHARLASALIQGFQEDEADLERPFTPEPRNPLERYFTHWTPEARTYALRHLPGHLLASRRMTEYQAALTDFAFSMQRCQPEVLPYFLADYREARMHCNDTPLRIWADAVWTQAHLLQRGNCDWPAHKIWLQVATEHAFTSPLTKAAEVWLQNGCCKWEWLKAPQMAATPTMTPGAPKTLAVEDFTDDRMPITLAMDADWRENSAVLACSVGNRDSGRRIWLKKFDLRKGCLAAVCNLNAEWDILQIRSLQHNQVEVTLKNGNAYRVTFSAQTTMPIVEPLDSAAQSPSPIAGTDILKHFSREAHGLSSPVRRAAFSADGKTCVVACEDDSLWQLHTGSGQPTRLESPSVKSHDLAVSANGHVAAAACHGGGVHVWKGGRFQATLLEHGYIATKVCMEPDGHRMVTAGRQDGRLIVWDLDSVPPPEGETPAAVPHEITAQIQLPHERSQNRPLLLAGDALGRIWRAQVFEAQPVPLEPWSAAQHPGRIWAMCVTPCKGYLLTAGENKRGGAICIWNIQTGHITKQISTRAEVKDLAISPDGRHLLTPGARGVLELRSLPELLNKGLEEVVRQIVPSEKLPGGGQAHREVRRTVFTSAREFLSTGDDSIIYIWHDLQGDWVQVAQLNHGETCESALHEARARTPAANDGSEAQQNGGGVSTTGAYALAVSVCGRFLACAGRGRHRAVTLWNIENRAEPTFVTILSHRVGKNRRGFHSLHFSLDGKHLWAAGWDESIVRWDTAAVGAPPSLVRHEALVSNCEKGPDETSLLVGTGSGKVRLLRLQGAPGLVRG